MIELISFLLIAIYMIISAFYIIILVGAVNNLQWRVDRLEALTMEDCKVLREEFNV